MAFLIALVSLLTTGGILDWSLPRDVPPWVAIAALVAGYALIAAPLRAVRYASYEALGPRRGWFVFWDGVLWLALVALAGWLAASYLPGVGDVFRDLFHHWREVRVDLARVIPDAAR